MFSTWVRYWLERFPPLSSQNPEVDVFAPTSARSVKRVRLCADVYVWWSYTITATVHKQFKGAHLDVYLLSFHLTLFKKTRHPGWNQEEGRLPGCRRSTGAPRRRGQKVTLQSAPHCSRWSQKTTALSLSHFSSPTCCFGWKKHFEVGQI